MSQQLSHNVYRYITGAVILLVVIQVTLAVQVGIFIGQLGDTDVYMWLNRVLQLHETGSWFDHTLHRIDPPYGYEQHWTRPFDLILYSGAWLGSIIADFDTSLHIWSVLISPILGILALVACFWAMRPVLEDEGFEVLGLLFITQVAVIATFAVGRADHQSLIILFFILTLGLGLRMLAAPFHRSFCYVTGLISALAIWVSMESILFALVIMLALGWFWLLGNREVSRKLLHYSVSTTVLLALFRLLEFGPDRLHETVFDQISIVYITLFGAITIFWLLIYYMEKKAGMPGGLISRFATVMVAAGIIGVVLEQLFPGIFAGPLGNVDEMFKRVYLSDVKELQPTVSLQAISSGEWGSQFARASLWLGIIVPGIPMLLYLIMKSTGTRRRAWLYLAVCLMVYLPLALKEIRWTPYVVILVLPAYALLVTRVMQYLAEKMATGTAGILRVLVLVASVIIFALPMELNGDQDKDQEDEKETCPLLSISRFLDDQGQQGDQTQRLLAFTDFGPELLYRTRYSVYSIPSHRFHQGFTDSYRIMTAQDDDEAWRIIQDRQVDLILICQADREGNFYKGDNKSEIFHQKLSRGQPPDWLVEVSLPDDIAKSFRLYSVTKQALQDKDGQY